MTTKHTPGPWKLKLGKGIQYTYLVADKKGQDIANWAHYPNATKAQTKANARLIAAAPDLLEALMGLLADITEYQTLNNLGGEDNHWQAIARAAIVKATGETQ